MSVENTTHQVKIIVLLATDSVLAEVNQSESYDEANGEWSRLFGPARCVTDKRDCPTRTEVSRTF